jgi:phage gp45-like
MNKEVMSYNNYQNSNEILSSCYPSIGKVAGMNDHGEIQIILGQKQKPITARMISRVNQFELMNSQHIGKDVLVVFENGNPELPIIIDLMADPVNQFRLLHPLEEEKELKLQAQNIVINASNSITIKCGESQFLITSDTIIQHAQKISSNAIEKIDLTCDRTYLSITSDKIIQHSKKIVSKAIEMIRMVGGAVRIN